MSSAMTIRGIPATFIWERLYPAIFGIACGAMWMAWGSRVAEYGEAYQWHFDGLYAAVLGVVAITTGFLATFYATVQSASTPFLDRIRSSKSYAFFILCIKRAMALGFVVSLATIPLLLIQPVPKQPLSLAAILFSLWIGATVWSLASFYRVASLLFLLLDTRAPKRRGAG